MKFSRLAILSFFLPVILFLFVPHASFAAAKEPDLCTCFCTSPEGVVAVNKEGAELKSDQILGAPKMAPYFCEQTVCKGKRNANMAACATKLEYFPTNNKLCFTEDQCKAVKDKDGKNYTKWGSLSGEKVQPPECVKGMYYCYPDLKKAEVNLSVKIGAFSKIGDLGQYVGILYQWLLGVSGVIAIVMIMIGGLQWVLSAATGNKKQAQDRIQNGVIGLILLLCLVLITKVVNPQLLTITVPKLPLIRALEVGGGKTCEWYIEQKYTVVSEDKDNAAICGVMGLVTKAPSGKEVVAGTTCQYTWCAKDPTDASQDQFCIGFGSKASCATCEEVIESKAATYGVLPSPQLCKTLSSNWDAAGFGVNDPKRYSRCGFTKDSDLNPDTKLKAGRVGSCAFYQVDCAKIKSCSDYDKVQVSNSHAFQPLEDIIRDNGWEAIGGADCGFNGCGNFGLQDICKHNPCYKANGGQVQTGCEYNERATFKDDCVPEGDSDNFSDWIPGW